MYVGCHLYHLHVRDNHRPTTSMKQSFATLWQLRDIYTSFLITMHPGREKDMLLNIQYLYGSVHVCMFMSVKTNHNTS